MMGQPELLNSIAMFIDRGFGVPAIFCLGPLEQVRLQIAACFFFVLACSGFVFEPAQVLWFSLCRDCRLP